MPKVLITFDQWKELEPVLMKHRIGYEVQFDDHNGTAEMLIHIQNIGVYRDEENKTDEIEEGI